MWVQAMLVGGICAGNVGCQAAFVFAFVFVLVFVFVSDMWVKAMVVEVEQATQAANQS